MALWALVSYSTAHLNNLLNCEYKNQQHFTIFGVIYAYLTFYIILYCISYIRGYSSRSKYNADVTFHGNSNLGGRRIVGFQPAGQDQ